MDPEYISELEINLQKAGRVHKYKGSKKDEKPRLLPPANNFYNNVPVS